PILRKCTVNERLLLQVYLEDQNVDYVFSSLSDELSQRLQNLVKNPSQDKLEAVLTDDPIGQAVKGYEEACTSGAVTSRCYYGGACAGTSAAGVSGILTNYNAYQRWVRSAHARSLYVDATLDMARMVDSQQDTKHRDVRPAEVRRGEKLVNAIKDAINSFLNPFTVETKDQLLIISSGSAASETVTKDVLKAETIGEQARDAFIEERLKPGERFS
ncbi:hypothetical protein SNEBB_009934, partial [Seison nebaliae]